MCTWSSVALVLVLGARHSEHVRSERYSLATLREVIAAIRPDIVLTEVPPDRFDRAAAEFSAADVISEPCDRLLNNDLGPGGWTSINVAHPR